VSLPCGFLDAYLERVVHHGFALAQPARTRESFVDHRFVTQRAGGARQTRFVEIGPLFSLSQAAAACLLPFDEISPMGWGYDWVWPLVLEAAGLTLGIIDAVPVGHTIRRPVAEYDGALVRQQQAAYLATHPHLVRTEAFTVVRSYP
jgi:hypothetical protein